MNVIKNIFARLWALWGIISFIATFLLIFIPSMVSYLIKGIKGQDYFIKVSRFWMNIWLPLVGCPVKVKGKQNFIPGRNYIVVFNHNTLLDVPLSAPYVPGPNKTIAKASFAKVPLFGWFYRKGSILVDRKNEKSRIQSYEAMKQVLAEGMHMSIYPEGTRNRTAEPLKPFYDGAFKLSTDTQKEIIPCIITGTKKAMPVNKFFYLLPVPLTMEFLPAISPANIPVKELKEKVFIVMKEQYLRSLQ
ncbi:lysophospholipid acyltransferase family protein [Ferruginibacter sp.]